MGTLDGAEGRELLADRYRIIQKLGEGGMGMVYLAEDTELDNNPVAIKFIPPMLAGNKRAIKNLKREAKTAMQLSHPHILRLHDLHTDGHQKFLVMEYIEGQTLEDLLAEQDDETLPVERVLQIADTMATALDFAHSQRVLHRDLKPANIMIGSHGSVKLLDFGIARQIKDSYTRVTGQETSGTLPYMSPQQLLGEEPTPSMDVYSFAAVLYECLSGHPPFYMGDIREQIKSKTPSLIDGCDSNINAVLMRALCKDSEQRPGSAREIVDALCGDARQRDKEGLKTPETGETQGDSSANVLDAKPADKGKAKPWTRGRKGLIALLLIILGGAGGGLAWFVPYQAERAKVKHSLDKVRKICLAIRLYAEDNDDKYPLNLKQLSPDYISRDSFFSPFDRGKSGFSYELVVSGSTLKIENPGQTVMVRELTRSARMESAVGFCDGNVRTEVSH
jgi:serine/threonine protein kinase